MWMTFWLTDKNIERIELELWRFKTVDMKYDSLTWEILWKELWWQPLTLALWYFRYLELKK